jgi:adenylate kinase
MNIVFLGPPGAGKGTQAVDMAKKLGICHISTGDILREAVRQGTPLGKKAKAFMDKGELVPDAVVVDVVVEALKKGACRKGWLLDGFPRTRVQAEELEKKAAALSMRGVELVLYLNVSDQVVIDRLAGRRMCRKCGASYHVKFMPSAKEDVCDKCGGELYLRDDDKPETVRNRLAAYRRDTAPLIAYYRERKLLVEVDGGGSPEAVRKSIEDAVARRFS